MSQFSSFVQLGGNISGAGISNGITKLATQNNSGVRLNLLIATSLQITFVASVLFGTILLFCSEYFSNLLLHSKQYSYLFKYSGLFLFFSAVTTLTLSLLQGLKRYSAFFKVKLFIVFSSLLLIVPAAYFYGIDGALWSTLIGFVFTGVFSFFVLDLSLIKPRFSRFVSKKFIGFSTMMVVALIVAPTVQIIVRNVIISYSSLEEAGLWDGVRRVSGNYTSIVVATLSLYLLPKFSEKLSFKELVREIFNSYKIVIPCVAIASTLIYVFRIFIIRILFSEQFFEMESLFIYQCIGDVFKIAAWFFAVVLMMQEKVKAYVFSEVFMGVIIVGLANYIMPRFGISGSTLIYFISNVVYLILMGILFVLNMRHSK
ncbi:O-antigen translocase [Carboxylicivirga sp. N1Y90]|uniref:O-antigen translocase n=1 Tax=Carboxylicivirga fragile TaxID=3417571 RepID=UPI003D346281|nr:O-antigen translocase [Marinilabiliaceae bacterium N1Y90]